MHKHTHNIHEQNGIPITTLLILFRSNRMNHGQCTKRYGKKCHHYKVYKTRKEPNRTKNKIVFDD